MPRNEDGWVGLLKQTLNCFSQTKHRKAVADILADLSKLKAQQAVKIPLSSLNGEKMQNLRSALNRVTRKKNIPVPTSSDEEYLYVWRADPPNHTGSNE